MLFGKLNPFSSSTTLLSPNNSGDFQNVNQGFDPLERRALPGMGQGAFPTGGMANNDNSATVINNVYNINSSSSLAAAATAAASAT